MVPECPAEAEAWSLKLRTIEVLSAQSSERRVRRQSVESRSPSKPLSLALSGHGPSPSSCTPQSGNGAQGFAGGRPIHCFFVHFDSDTVTSHCSGSPHPGTFNDCRCYENKEKKLLYRVQFT